jgi:CRP-like cAMP-binding protein
VVWERDYNAAMNGNQAYAERNHLLRHLDSEGIKRLQPRLTPTQLHSQDIIYHPGQRITDIYFPETAVLCMMTIMEDGRSVESATVGSEGASWVSASYGSPPMPCQTMVSVGGMARRISAEHVEDEIKRNGVFHNLLSEYSHTLLISSLRTGACNTLHTVTQRCARWMLTTLDRTNQERFGITHDFLAGLLGCSRPTLTAILGELESAGGIQTSRGIIDVVDRKRLEQSVCECYALVHQAFVDLRARAGHHP